MDYEHMCTQFVYSKDGFSTKLTRSRSVVRKRWLFRNFSSIVRLLMLFQFFVGVKCFTDMSADFSGQLSQYGLDCGPICSVYAVFCWC